MIITVKHVIYLWKNEKFYSIPKHQQRILKISCYYKIYSTKVPERYAFVNGGKYFFENNITSSFKILNFILLSILNIVKVCVAGMRQKQPSTKQSIPWNNAIRTKKNDHKTAHFRYLVKQSVPKKSIHSLKIHKQ